MLEFYDPAFFCEEEVVLKIRNNLMNKFHLDRFSATDLALEIMEMLTLSDSDINTLNKYYISQKIITMFESFLVISLILFLISKLLPHS